MQVAVAGLDCNRSEVVQECLERLVGEHFHIPQEKIRSFAFCCLDLS